MRVYYSAEAERAGVSTAVAFVRESWGARQADSQLVHQLRNAAWIPQGDEVFVRPEAAFSNLLPDGFPFDAGQKWLKAVGFGREIEMKSEEQRQKEETAKGHTIRGD